MNIGWTARASVLTRVGRAVVMLWCKAFFFRGSGGHRGGRRQANDRSRPEGRRGGPADRIVRAGPRRSSMGHPRAATGRGARSCALHPAVGGPALLIRPFGSVVPRRTTE